MTLARPTRPRTALLAVLGPLLAASTTARAQQALPGDADAVSERPTGRNWDGAVGLVAGLGPEYAGSDRVSARLQPGFALRWGRVSFASRSAFAVRGPDTGAGGGLRVELARSDRFRAGLGLRIDSGRPESSSDRLAGMGDVPRTVRARLSASYRFDAGWRLGAAVMVDALGRGTGTVAELIFGREQRFSDRTTFGYAVTLAGGDSTYLQSHFGVTPEQAKRSGYAVYEPGAGLRDLGVSIGARTELAPHWAAFFGASASRKVGAASRSPLTLERYGPGLSAGLVFRF